MSIAANIKSVLSSKGMTVRQLASASGVPEPSLYKMLEKNEFKSSVLLKLSKALDVSISYLFIGKNELDSNRTSVQYEAELKELNHELHHLKRLISFIGEIDLIDFEQFKQSAQFPWPPGDTMETFPITAWLGYFSYLSARFPDKEKFLTEFYTISRLMKYGKIDTIDPELLKLIIDREKNE